MRIGPATGAQEDPGFFKARRSRIEVRNLAVRLSASLTCNNLVVQRAVWQTYQKFDWAALARLVEPPADQPPAAEWCVLLNRISA